MHFFVQDSFQERLINQSCYMAVRSERRTNLDKTILSGVPLDETQQSFYFTAVTDNTIARQIRIVYHRSLHKFGYDNSWP